ncbi:hypothetical protein J2755_000665 [Methanohalophilus levihalophilus]|uniref:hypothetical protein n=1 Tax=Methanohalophilus levihalophilus TaxID=1431282 RepID=UPI001AE6043E|nr:hypothetical protein [Methanohalophilus levihalophilus]MBP2029745.1 hypothetical protein [Methanohalophilus levihalophilus]
MVLALDLQKQILDLYLDGKKAYAISQELKINYRTAKKYTDRLDLVMAEIRTAVVCCIFDEIRKNPENFVDYYMQVQDMQEENT